MIDHQSQESDLYGASCSNLSGTQHAQHAMFLVRGIREYNIGQLVVHHIVCSTPRRPLATLHALTMPEGTSSEWQQGWARLSDAFRRATAPVNPDADVRTSMGGHFGFLSCLGVTAQQQACACSDFG